jgi:flagellin
LGALINRFEASISSQSNSIMNLSESRSRILDADYAKETSLLAKSMIIQQAATAMLGQANQNPRLVLHLLK